MTLLIDTLAYVVLSVLGFTFTALSHRNAKYKVKLIVLYSVPAIIAAFHVFVGDVDGLDFLLILFIIASSLLHLRNSKEDYDQVVLLKQMFQDIANSSADMLFEVDENGNYTFTEIGEFIGIPVKTSKLKNHFIIDLDKLSPNLVIENGVKREIRKQVQDALVCHKPITELRYVVYANGEKTHIETSAVPFFVDGKFAGYRGVHKNITALKQAEFNYRDACEEVESFLEEHRLVVNNFEDLVNSYRDVLEQTSDQIFIVSEDKYQVLLANKSAKQAYGIYDFENKPLKDISPELHRHIQSQTNFEENSWKTIYVPEYGLDVKIIKTIFQGSNVLITMVDGFYQYREIIEKIKSDKSKLSVFQNIALYVADQLPIYIWAKDKQGRYIFVNKAAASTFFQLPRGSVIGKTNRDLLKNIPQTIRHDLLQNLTEADKQVLSGEHVNGEDSIYVCGKLIWVDYHKAPFYDDHGNVIGVVGIANKL